MDAESPTPPPLPPPLTALDATPVAPRPEVWGPWATLGWGAVIAFAYIVAQSLAATIVVFLNVGPSGLKKVTLEEWSMNGQVVAWATLASAPVLVGLCVVVARIREGLATKDYFDLRWITWKAALKWFVAFFVFLAVVDWSLSHMESHTTEEFMKTVMQTAGWSAPMLWLAIVVLAPVSEEFFFRGFLFTGLQRSRVGTLGAIVIPGLLFASIHMQYDLQGLLFVLFAGLFFGYARARSGSLYICMALHGFMNLLATLTEVFSS